MENNVKELKKTIKGQNKDFKQKNKEIKELSKRANPQVEADFILLSKSINKRYKMQGLAGQKANNDYIKLLLDDILKIITNALTKKERFNLVEYKNLIEELKTCLDTRDLISITRSISDDVALHAIGDAYTQKLKRIEANKAKIIEKLKEKKAECDANPSSQALRSELQSIKYEYDKNEMIYKQIISIVNSNNLNAYVEGAQKEFEIYKEVEKPNIEVNLVEAESIKIQTQINDDANKSFNTNLDSEIDDILNQNSTNKIEETNKEDTSETIVDIDVDKIKNLL